MRRLAWVLLFLGVVALGLAVGDGAARDLAEERVAAQIQEAENLDTPPAVSIEDRFFLLSAARGDFERVTVTSAAVPAEGLELSDVTAQLSGVRVPVGEVLAGRMPPVTADRVQVQARVDYPAVTRLVRERVRAAGDGTARVEDLQVAAGPQQTLRVTGRLELLGIGLRIDLPVSVTLDGDQLVLTASPESTGVAAQAASLIDARIDVPPLPYGLTVDSVSPGPDGLELVATGTDVSVN